ncbi:hypothetical protein DPEC_G00031950 [Dallia pectoralis]|uniref:Uncharacterized protein n=1 Tax=Dallia pectoralis TaxID=75939 RepID=A0ACC2HCD8_DALPE|nr:hypothetical protein DPEC_G00031950 [Dallia pectoralis]
MNTSASNSTSVVGLYQQGVMIITVSYAVNLILTLPANGYVLWIIANGARGTMVAEFFTLNLAVCDILFCLFSVFYAVGISIQIPVVSYLGRFGLGFLCAGRPLFQGCVSVERHLAVIHPVTFLKYKPLRYRAGCCGAIWFMIFLYSLFYSFLTGIYSTIYYYVVLAQSLALMSLMLFCCLSVLRVLEQPGPGDGDRDREKEARNVKLKAFNIILFNVVLTMSCYLPIFVAVCLYAAIAPGLWFFIYSISLSVALINGIVQPLFYLHRARKLPCSNSC